MVYSNDTADQDFKKRMEENAFKKAKDIDFSGNGRRNFSINNALLNHDIEYAIEIAACRKAPKGNILINYQTNKKIGWIGKKSLPYIENALQELGFPLGSVDGKELKKLIHRANNKKNGIQRLLSQIEELGLSQPSNQAPDTPPIFTTENFNMSADTIDGTTFVKISLPDIFSNLAKKGYIFSETNDENGKDTQESDNDLIYNYTSANGITRDKTYITLIYSHRSVRTQNLNTDDALKQFTKAVNEIVARGQERVLKEIQKDFGIKLKR